MSGSIILKTLKDMRGALIGWGIAFAIYGVMMVALFPTFLGDGTEGSTEGLEAFWDTMPEAFKDMFGDFSELMTPHGFLEAEFLKFLGLAMSVFMVTQCARLLAGEEEGRSIDLLLSQPVHRWHVVLEKYLGVVAGIFIVLFTTGISMEITAALTEGFESDFGAVLLEVIDVAPVCMVMGGLAFLGSAIFRKKKFPLALGSIVAGTLWFVNLIAPIFQDYAYLQKWTIYYHFENSSPMLGELEPIYYAVALPLIALLFGFTLWAYEKKDLRT